MNRTNNTRTTDLLRTGKKASTRTAYLLSGTVMVAALFAGCSLLEQDNANETLPPEPVDVSNVRNAVPEALPLSRYGNPTSYVVSGKRYYTMPASKDYRETGIASWYGTESQGKRTSSGETYDNYGMTAAHRTLPLPTFAKVTNKQNGRSVIVKINDRGPFHNNRLIDLSYVAAMKLGIVGYGTGLVEVTAIDPEEFNSDRDPALRQASKQPYLQAGAFSVRKNAERLRADIEAQDIGAVSIAQPSAINRLYKVMVGPFKDISEAEQVASILKPQGISGIIHHGKTSDVMAQAETVAMKAYSPEPASSSSKTEVVNSTAQTMVMAKDAPEPEVVVDEVEVVEMAAAPEEPQAVTDTSQFNLWSWMKSSPETSAETAVAADSAAPAVDTADVEITTLATEEPEAADSPVEAVAMESDSVEPAPEGNTSRFNLWNWMNSDTDKSGEAAMAAESSETAMAEISAPVAETPETVDSPVETVAMETNTEDSQAESNTGRFNLWSWMKAGTDKSADAAMTADTPAPMADTEVAEVADSKPEPVVTKPMAATPEATQPAQQATASSIYMETGAFRLRENAERLRPHVEAVAPGTFNVIETYTTRRLYKIQIGPLASTEEALKVKRELKAVGINPSIKTGSMNNYAGSNMVASTSTYTPQAAPIIEKPVIAKLMAAPAPVKKVTSPVVAATPTRAAPDPMPVRKMPDPAPERKMAAISTPTRSNPEPEPTDSGRQGDMALYQQAGAFARRKNADRLRTRIIDTTEEPTEILQQPNWMNKDGDRIILHRVQVGPLADKTEAMKVKHDLIPMGVDDSFPVYRQK